MSYDPWSLLTDAGLIGGLLLVGTLVRRWVGLAQRLMLPASVLAGFLGLLLGPKVLGLLPFSDQLGTYASVLIAVIFACLALSDDMGVRGFGPSTGAFSLYSMGMYALQVGLGMLLALLVFTPAFGTPAGFGLLLFADWAGGFGSAAAIGSVFEDAGWAEAGTLAFTSATVGLLVGVVGGIVWANWGARRGHTQRGGDFADLPEALRTGLVRDPDERGSIGSATTTPVETVSVALPDHRARRRRMGDRRRLDGAGPRRPRAAVRSRVGPPGSPAVHRRHLREDRITAHPDADVAVVGLGAMGAMSAWRLAHSGARVLGFEQFGIAHDRGAAGGESRLFRMAYHEGPEYVPLLRHARELWRELAEASGRDLFIPTGCLSIGLPDLPPMVNVRRSVVDHGLEHEMLTTDEVASRYPQHRLHDGEIGILDVAGGMLRPELAVLAAAQRARALGARLHEHTAVRAIEPGDCGATVVTDEGRYRVRRVVVTAGPWTGELLPDVAVTVKPIVLTWFAPADLRAYGPDRFPAFIRDTDGVHLFGCPVLDGMSVKCGYADVWAPLPGPRALTRNLPDTELRSLSDAVHRFLPGLHPEPIRHNVYMDGYTPDRTAVVGALPDAPSVVVLAGFSGHGFKMAPAFGSIAADLALEGGTSFDVARMSPARFAAAA